MDFLQVNLLKKFAKNFHIILQIQVGTNILF